MTLSTGSAEAREAYLEGVDRLLHAKPEPEKAFARAVERDPNFALAQAGLARSLFLAARVAEARTTAGLARSLTAGLPERERGNVEVVLLTVEGDPARAYALAREHLTLYPTDAMVLAPCTGVFGLIGFSGRKGRELELRELMEHLAPRYGDEPWFLVQLAFARVETGDTELARETVERALELDPKSAHGAHVKAHVHYEASETEEGLAFLEGWLPGYATSGLLHCHISWHVALWQLALGDPAAGIETYLRTVCPAATWGPPINVFTDSASFLWRAELAGLSRDDGRWHDVKGYGEERFPKTGLAFVDVHRAIVYAATGDGGALATLLEELHGRARAGKLSAGPIVPALTRAFDAFERRDFPQAVALLEPYMAEHERIGGSRAQRRIIDLTLAAARAAG